MSTIALATSEAQHLCFLLVAGSDPLSTGPSTRECILTGTPVRAEDFEHPLSQVRYCHLHKKLRMSVKDESGSLGLDLQIPPAIGLHIVIAADGSGSFRLEVDGGSTTGRCALVKKSARPA